jgi:hypothetical protein
LPPTYEYDVPLRVPVPDVPPIDWDVDHEYGEAKPVLPPVADTAVEPPVARLEVPPFVPV